MGSRAAIGALRDPPHPPLVPASGAYLGVYMEVGSFVRNSTSGCMVDLPALERVLGRTLRIDLTYRRWRDTSTECERADIANHRIPLTTWRLADLRKIASGSLDAHIRRKAEALKALGHRVFFRPGWEMNGDWMPWNASHYGGNPRLFVSAWRHVHDVFERRGATNVVWVWSPATYERPLASEAPWNHWTHYYPGDAYVDWVGMDGYNRGTAGAVSSWRSFSQIFQRLYADYASRKPIMVAESASVEQGGNKADWISGARRAIRDRFTDIRAMVWFNRPLAGTPFDWRLNTSASALTAFETLAQRPYFRA
jgi:beta-mannanase